MSKRRRDLLAKAEAKFLPKPEPDRQRMFFPVRLCVEMLDGHDAYVARCRAQHVAQGHAVNDDARPNFYCDTHEEWEAYAMAQQAKLIREAQGEIDTLTQAQEQAAHVGSQPKPQPQYVRASDLLHHV